jgi:DNA-binding PadR family transcriptional regulator
MYGYQLRQEFEGRTGATWPLNIGQVYTTLSRLQRDGLVVERERHDGSVVYGLTGAGREEVARWWSTPVERGAPARDELAIKLALAVTVPGVDVTAVVQRQRAETLHALQEYTILTARALDDVERDGAGGHLSWLLILDSLVFGAEAEVRWLDHVEQRLAAAARTPRRTTAGHSARTDAAEVDVVAGTAGDLS